MNRRLIQLRVMVCLFIADAGLAEAQISVTSARIGCLDIQKEPNLTAQVASSCNGQFACSYKAPTESEYKKMGVQARTRTFCTQGMEINYQCKGGGSKFVSVPGDAWDHPAAQLACEHPASSPGPTGESITITGARIGCLDVQKTPNLTALVARACNGRPSCSYKAPTESQYRAAGVRANTRTFCTQAMEILFHCGAGANQVVTVPGDAWNNPPAELNCNPTAVTPQSIQGGYQVGVIPPEPKPVIPPGNDIILYVHGGPSSRLEEASDLANPLLAAGLKRGKHYTIISFDQPSQGYSSMVAPDEIVPPHDQIHDYYPLVSFSEEFITTFLQQVVTPIQNRNVYIIGGSLGGALTLRMGHRPEPWIKKIVAWNPASVWTTYSHDVYKGIALDSGFGRAKASDDPGRREEYFNFSFGMPTPSTQPNPEEWYRGDRDHYYHGGAHTPLRSEWGCKWDYISASRIEQQEVYNPNFRLWHWRLGTELLIFSFHNDSWDGPAKTASETPVNSAIYEAIRKPTLLVASDDDDWDEGDARHWENRWTRILEIAGKMRNTPGYTLYLPDTGHSIHNERPALFADQIAAFLSGGVPSSGPLQIRPILDESTMPREVCQPSLAQLPRIPPSLLDNPESATYLLEPANLGGRFSNNHTAGQYSLRLTTGLRAVAQRKDPRTALANAALRFYGGDELMGNAFADLAVTGRSTYDAFRRHPPTDAQIETAAQAIESAPSRRGPPPKLDENRLRNAVATAQRRAYQVAWALRNPNPRDGFNLRAKLGWIAVSGEDDPPARPVNVPSGIPIFGPDGKQISTYPQYEIPVTMCRNTNKPYVPHPCSKGVTFNIRYTVASD